jgi:hypothetical protein
MRRGVLPACAFLGTALAAPPAGASVRITIDLSSQTMHVRSESGSYDWPISTARSGYRTPHGTYHPYALLRMHYSHKYHMSPMPYSIFFAGGYAIHGTYETRWLGHPASHGCIRLAPGNAARLFHMVQSEGAQISITGTPPSAGFYYARLHRKPAYYAAWHNKQRGALAYVPSHHAPPVKTWELNPVARPLQQWPAWPW